MDWPVKITWKGGKAPLTYTFLGQYLPNTIILFRYSWNTLDIPAIYIRSSNQKRAFSTSLWKSINISHKALAKNSPCMEWNACTQWGGQVRAVLDAPQLERLLEADLRQVNCNGKYMTYRHGRSKGGGETHVTPLLPPRIWSFGNMNLKKIRGV